MISHHRYILILNCKEQIYYFTSFNMVRVLQVDDIPDKVAAISKLYQIIL